MPAPIAMNLARILHRLLLDPRGWRVETLKEEFGIADRTYRKYRSLLSEHFAFDKHWDCVEVMDGEFRYLRLQARKVPSEDQQGFLSHVAAFFLARKAFGFAGDLKQGMDQAWVELVSGIKDKPYVLHHLLKDVDRMLYVVPDAPKDYSDRADDLKLLLHGLFHRRRVRFRYTTNPEWNEVCPLTLVVYRSALYLVGRYKPDQEPYLFAVDRMSELSLTTRFDYPTDYDPSSVFEGAFGIYQGKEEHHVDLLFENRPWLHRYLTERRWHPTQSFEEQKDGRLRMRFTVSSMAEVNPWIKSFGEDVTVVA